MAEKEAKLPLETEAVEVSDESESEMEEKLPAEAEGKRFPAEPEVEETEMEEKSDEYESEMEEKLPAEAEGKRVPAEPEVEETEMEEKSDESESEMEEKSDESEIKEKLPAKVENKGKIWPAVPEAWLKRKKRNAEAKRAKVEAQNKARHAKKLENAEIFRRSEKYAMEYREQKLMDIQLKQEAQKEGSIIVAAEPKLAFVIRIRGVNQIAPKPRKILQLFRLLQLNNGVFVKLNKATLNMLRVIEPYIAWGYPTLRTIRRLLYKRGYIKINRCRTALTSNDQIKEALGKRGIICFEDLVHEIYTVGPNFQKATNTLWQFKLNNPKRGWRKKTTHYVEGGDFGNREEFINKLIDKMIKGH